MKKLIFIALLCAFLTVPAMADMTITVADSVGGTSGGEFTVTVTGDAIGIYGNGAKFGTFCIESTEYLSFGPTYYVTLSTAAVLGGVGPSDPLDDESAWLYTKWLDDGTFTHTAANADLIQNAIWYFENEGGSNNTEAQAATAAMPWTNPDIMVMNLWTNSDHTGYAQDLLVRVPVPGAVLLGILGLGAAGWRLRRFA